MLNPGLRPGIFCQNQICQSLLDGSGDEDARLALHKSGLLVLSGKTASADFSLSQNAIQNSMHGDGDLYISLFDPHAKKLVYSSFWGGDVYITRFCLKK